MQARRRPRGASQTLADPVETSLRPARPATAQSLSAALVLAAQSASQRVKESLSGGAELSSGSLRPYSASPLASKGSSGDIGSSISDARMMIDVESGIGNGNGSNGNSGGISSINVGGISGGSGNGGVEMSTIGGGVRSSVHSSGDLGFLGSSQSPMQYFVYTTRCVLLGSKLNILMLLCPLAAVGDALEWSPGLMFMLSLLAIAPFAERLGYVTEQLAMHTNDTLGGLLNATFGNATEVIISLFALLKGRPSDESDTSPELYQRLVQVSLLGSVLSNLLLVLGSAMLVGGLRYTSQKFNRIGSSVSTSLLLLAAGACAMPWVLKSSAAIEEESVLPLSRLESLVLVVQYCLFLNFQLRTHRHLYENSDDVARDLPDLVQVIDPNGRGTDISQVPRRYDGFQIVRNSSINIDSCTDVSEPGERIRSARLQVLPESAQGELSQRRPTGVKATNSDPPVAMPTPGYASGDSGVSSGSVPLRSNSEGGNSSSLSGGDYRDFHHSSAAGMPNSGRTSPCHMVGTSPKPSLHRPATSASFKSGGNLSPNSVCDVNDDDHDNSDDEDEDELVLGFWTAIAWLAIISIAISVLSEYLVDAIKGAAASWELSSEFMGSILIPVVGNAAEHASAVMFAYKNKMDIAIGVALGSATQIAVSVLPFCVLLGWAIGTPLDLAFAPFEVLILTISILTVSVIVRDGTSHWLYGTSLISAYAIIAIAFLHFPPQ